MEEQNTIPQPPRGGEHARRPAWINLVAAVAAAAAAVTCGVVLTVHFLHRPGKPAVAPVSSAPVIIDETITEPTTTTTTTTETTTTTAAPTTTTTTRRRTTTTTTRRKTVPAPSIVVEPSGVKDDTAPTKDSSVSNPSTVSGVTLDMVRKDFQGEKYRIGIDVSRHNNTIDWKKVKAAGVEFAIIRCGYRTYGTQEGGGKVYEDANFHQNIKGALAAGVKVGIYFFSAAKNEYEALEEAAFVCKVLEPYKKDITWPVAYDFEIFDRDRLAGVSYTTITDNALAFMDVIAQAGYTPMVYSSRNMLWNQFETARLAGYRTWMAHYVNTLDQKKYGGDHAIWQCASDGIVPGISGRVDMNIAYEDLSKSHDVRLPVTDPADWPREFKGFSFTSVLEEVEVTAGNLGLRTSPDSQLPNRYATGQKGQRLLRTGVDEKTGWSRLEIDGVTLYARTEYLKFCKTVTTTAPPTTTTTTVAVSDPEPSAPESDLPPEQE